MSEETKESPSEAPFLERLTALQNELMVPKTKFNEFGKFNYRSCEDILSVLKPLLSKYRLTLTLTDEPIMVGEWHYIRADAMLIDADDISSSFTCSAYAREIIQKKGSDPAQITGMASSYARKYALGAMFLIDDSNDPDAHDNSQQPQQPQQPPQQPRHYDAARIRGGVNSVMQKYQMQEADVWMHLEHDLGINRNGYGQQDVDRIGAQLERYYMEGLNG